MPEWLSRRFGPLPAWGWAALGAGGFIFYRWRKNKAASSSPTSMNVNATPAPDPTVSLTTPGGFSYSGPESGLGFLYPPASSLPTGAIAQTGGANAPNQVTSPTGRQQLVALHNLYGPTMTLPRPRQPLSAQQEAGRDQLQALHAAAGMP